MKLITKTLLYYLLVSLPLLLVAVIFSYHLIKEELSDATNESLWKEKLIAEKLIRSSKSPAVIYLSTDSLSKVVPVQNDKTGFAYADSIIYDQFEEEDLNYRILKHYYKYNGQNFVITVTKSTMEDDDLMESLLKPFIIVVALLIIAFFIVSWLLSKTLWKPFYRTINQLGDYEIKNHSVVKFNTSSTKEFKQLNETLNTMTEKLYSDYIQQKEFTENASHEMQTPLAIIKANISLLMQSPNLKAVEMDQIQVIDNTVKKLTSLNKALLLLSKIENNQFSDTSNIHLKEVVNRALLNYQHVIEAKSLQVELSLNSDVMLSVNSTLVDILITNLIQNSIRHNYDNGSIKIEISENNIIISNTGAPLAVNSEDLFVRFKKNNASKESLGLGLSIVKSIVELYNFQIEYKYDQVFHTFIVKF